MATIARMIGLWLLLLGSSNYPPYISRILFACSEKRPSLMPYTLNNSSKRRVLGNRTRSSLFTTIVKTSTLILRKAISLVVLNPIKRPKRHLEELTIPIPTLWKARISSKKMPKTRVRQITHRKGKIPGILTRISKLALRHFTSLLQPSIYRRTRATRVQDLNKSKNRPNLSQEALLTITARSRLKPRGNHNSKINRTTVTPNSWINDKSRKWIHLT